MPSGFWPNTSSRAHGGMPKPPSTCFYFYWTGAMWWLLQDFAAKPGWAGGDPRGTPPFVQKGLFDFSGNPKPVEAVVSQVYRSTRQIENGINGIAAEKRTPKSLRISLRVSARSVFAGRPRPFRRLVVIGQKATDLDDLAN